MTQTRSQTTTRAILWFAAFVATVFGANWMIQTYGFVSVGFGLSAPAGVYFAGAAFSFRDGLHRRAGRVPVLAAIGTGAAASWFVSPDFAVASAVAFGLSELADFAVYTPLMDKRPLAAVALSNTVGAVVDSAVFLWLAFGSLDFIWGQIVGKSWITAASVAIVWGWRARSRR